ncbi:cyclophane-forming radical SAM peptide maturase AmcB [Spirillospora sp. NPDC127200]
MHERADTMTEGRKDMTRNTGYDRYIGQLFHTVIVQPTSFCNANCSYCYLPGRKARNEMPIEVAEAVAVGISRQGSTEPVDVVWHGGEPLALGLSGFERRLQPFERLRCDGLVEHSVQTNGTLVDQHWCRLFRDYGVRVGVSIDGPQGANVDRVDWVGRPIFDRIMRGITALRDQRIPFSVIAVVTPQTIGDPAGLLEFLGGLGAVRVGFNLEEHEGLNTARAMIDADAAEAFWGTVISHRRGRGGGPRVRELEALASYLARARTGRKEEWNYAPHDPIPTVAWNGDTVLLSPELLGIRAPAYDDFVVGNVRQELLTSMLERAPSVRYVREFVAGLTACEATCAFFAFCRGAQAGNRYFEHGTFAVTETAHCRNTRQALVRALASSITDQKETIDDRS